MISGTMNEQIAELARKYTSVSSERLDVTHCLDDGDFFFCPDFEWFSDVEEEDMGMFAEVYQQVNTRFVERLPEDYEVLKKQMLPALRQHAQELADQIDRLYALPRQAPGGKLKSRLHELRRLSECISTLVAERGKETQLSAVFPECIEPRVISARGYDAQNGQTESSSIPCVIFAQAGFYPTFTYERASNQLGMAYRRISSTLEDEKERASELYRSFVWLRAQWNSLKESITEYEVYGHVPQMSLEEAKRGAREEVRRRGRPRQSDREKVRKVILKILANRRSCWHQSGQHEGNPNASAIHKRLLRDHSELITKDDGSPFTEAWVRNRISEMDDGALEEARSRQTGSRSN
jgi:hypothetical protein